MKKNDLPDFDEKKKMAAELRRREEEINDRLDKIYSEQQILTNKISAIEADTEKTTEDIAKSKIEDGTIHEEELQQKCRETIDDFLKDVNIDQANFSLSIMIEYQQMKIFKSLTEENITFGGLKDETKAQLGRKANEFFFADQNGGIYGDELKVVPALFPLSKVMVDKYQPIIKVVEKQPISKLRLKEVDNFDELSKSEEELPEDNEFKKTNKQRVLIFLVIISIIFLGIWSSSAIQYMHISDYKVYKQTYISSLNPLLVSPFKINDTSKMLETINQNLTSFMKCGKKYFLLFL